MKEKFRKEREKQAKRWKKLQDTYNEVVPEVCPKCGAPYVELVKHTRYEFGKRREFRHRTYTCWGK